MPMLNYQFFRLIQRGIGIVFKWGHLEMEFGFSSAEISEIYCKNTIFFDKYGPVVETFQETFMKENEVQ